MSAYRTDRPELVEQMKATIEALQAELTENRTLLQGMLDCMPGLVYRASQQADGRSRFHFVSDSAHEVAGMAPAHLTGGAKALFDHVHPEDRPGLAWSPRWREVASNCAPGVTPTGLSTHARDCAGKRSWPFLTVDTTELWSGLDTFRTCPN